MHEKIVPMKNTKESPLGLIAIVREESYFIEEWLYFHQCAGIDRFYLVYQGNDDTLEKIRKLPFSKNIIAYKRPDYGNVEAYRFLMDKHRSEVEWMILADVDEFYFNPGGSDLKDVLKEYQSIDCGGIIVPWTSMGLNGYVERPPLPITDHIVLCQSPPQQQQYKVILKTAAYAGCDCEWFFNAHKPYIHQDGTEFQSYGSPVTDRCFNKIKCHHYFARGLQDLVDRCKRYKDDEKYPCDLFGALHWLTHWSDINEDAAIYSKHLRKTLGILSHDAALDNTLFVSVADYANPTDVTKLFTTSAAANDVEITWASYGGKWKGFIHNKAEKVLAFLKKQQSHGKKYAFVLDCADVVFVKPLQNILDKFNRVYKGGVLFNCDYDNVMWPRQDPLLQWHITSCYGRNGILNAGCYCGLISDIVTLLEQVLDVRNQILEKDYRQLCTKIFSASGSCGYEKKIFDSKGKLIEDDQWLLHIMQCEVNPLINVDKYKQIFALTEGYTLHPRSVYARDCIGTAGILHISHILQNQK
jgi:hypothetical protein